MADLIFWQYYETAANLGDTGESKPALPRWLSPMMPCGERKLIRRRRTDAMNEVAWCYLEGFGCKKDKASLPTAVRYHSPPKSQPLNPAQNLGGLGPRASWLCLIPPMRLAARHSGQRNPNALGSSGHQRRGRLSERIRRARVARLAQTLQPLPPGRHPQGQTRLTMTTQ